MASVLEPQSNSRGMPTIAKQTKAPQTRILSTNGSIMRPNFVAALNRRAMWPSMMSENPAMTNRTKATSRKNGRSATGTRGKWRIIHKKMMVNPSRMNVSMFGTCFHMTESLQGLGDRFNIKVV